MEPSNAEVMRRLDDFATATREDLAEIKAAHGSFVLREVYEARHEALTAKVTALELRQTQEADQRRNLSRWVIGSVVLPLLFFAYTVINAAQGSGA